jgi:hypothetical protein
MKSDGGVRYRNTSRCGGCLEEYEIPIACQYRDGLAEIVNLLCVDPDFNVFDQRIVALAVDVEPEERGVLLELRS